MDNLRNHPAKWTGIALGAGFGVGLISRILLERVNRPLPKVIVLSRAN
jgi:hypothetical protein